MRFVRFLYQKGQDRVFHFYINKLSMYTTTEAGESHCNFRGTKQETSKLLQVAHLPSCLGFIPGVSTGAGTVHVENERTGRKREGWRGTAQRGHT